MLGILRSEYKPAHSHDRSRALARGAVGPGRPRKTAEATVVNLDIDEQTQEERS